ncbi:Gfo/Idh/MocA family protein [Rhodohalobacter sp.]|uniref:Gfo/Idh/MocA family protein n=1 Tax=Rhodohalobacter sp. TaxID=1974210 RepID=UPI003561733C
MEKRKKILFFGLGSIGLRHAGLLHQNFDVELAAYRTTDTKNKLGIREFTSLESAFDFQPDAAFVTNPTDQHIETALECAKRSVHLFIEKPLSNHTEGIPELIGLIDDHNLVNHVAFCMRYHPVIKYLKKNINMTDAFYARTICSSYFPLWRPGQDYRKSYSADINRGGGVVNELVHELDYNQHLFGDIDVLKLDSGQVSELEISAPDYAEFQSAHTGGLKSHISLDFFSHLKERTVKIYFPDKVVEGDILDQTVRIFKNTELEQEIALSDENMYLNQLITFMGALESHDQSDLCSVKSGYKILKLLN